jgi:hypothetical protein
MGRSRRHHYSNRLRVAAAVVRPAGEQVWYPAERDVRHCPDARRYPGVRHCPDAHRYPETRHCPDAHRYPETHHCPVARRYPVCPVTADPGASDAVAGWAAEVAAAPRVAVEDSAESAV